LLDLLREKAREDDSDSIKSKDVREEQLLSDHPEVEDAWLEYLSRHWEPWKEEMLIWNKMQLVYENVDFMRRRLEDDEEHYELVLALGLLQWRDPSGVTVKRHILTAPAEISQDAKKGVLTVTPAASFDRFRIEFDMLEREHQPVYKELEKYL
jgi:hypothetical protein